MAFEMWGSVQTRQPAGQGCCCHHLHRRPKQGELAAAMSPPALLFGRCCHQQTTTSPAWATSQSGQQQRNCRHHCHCRCNRPPSRRHCCDPSGNQLATRPRWEAVVAPEVSRTRAGLCAEATLPPATNAPPHRHQWHETVTMVQVHCFAELQLTPWHYCSCPRQHCCLDRHKVHELRYHAVKYWDPIANLEAGGKNRTEHLVRRLLPERPSPQMSMRHTAAVLRPGGLHHKWGAKASTQSAMMFADWRSPAVVATLTDSAAVQQLQAGLQRRPSLPSHARTALWQEPVRRVTARHGRNPLAKVPG